MSLFKRVRRAVQLAGDPRQFVSYGRGDLGKLAHPLGAFADDVRGMVPLGNSTPPFGLSPDFTAQRGMPRAWRLQDQSIVDCGENALAFAPIPRSSLQYAASLGGHCRQDSQLEHVLFGVASIIGGATHSLRHQLRDTGGLFSR